MPLLSVKGLHFIQITEGEATTLLG